MSPKSICPSQSAIFSATGSRGPRFTTTALSPLPETSQTQPRSSGALDLEKGFLRGLLFTHRDPWKVQRCPCLSIEALGPSRPPQHQVADVAFRRPLRVS